MARHFTDEDGPEDLTGFITSGTNGSLSRWVDDRPAPAPITPYRDKLRALRDEMARIADQTRMKMRGVVL